MDAALDLAFVLCCSIVVLAVASSLVRVFILPLLGIDWLSRRVKVPWRFSVRAIGVLTALAACVCALMRDSPALAIYMLCSVGLFWLAIVRFLEFRRMLAERRNKQLASAIAEHLNPAQESGVRP